MLDKLGGLFMRFGGASLAAEHFGDDGVVKRSEQNRAEIAARLRAIEIDLDVTARRRLDLNKRGY